LAEILGENYKCIFIVHNPSERVEKLIRQALESIEIIKITNPFDLSFCNWLTRGDIVVLDGYHFTTDFQRSVRKNEVKLICIDDLHDRHYVADAIINHGGGLLTEKDFSKEVYTKLFLGLDYPMIRKEFGAISNDTFKKDSLLICLGSTLQNGVLNRVLSALSTHSIFSKIDVLGEKNGEIKSDFKFITFEQDVRKLIAIINDYEFILCPASTFFIETFFLKKKIICGYFVDNQNDGYNYFVKSDFCVGVGDLKEFSEKRLNKAMDEMETKNIKFKELNENNILNIFNEI
jgi:UDP-2,4-diacetamido-2,4,6-trideoxy-beta-L-altropyranose hydrolase